MPKKVGIDEKHHGNYSLLPPTENSLRQAAGDELTVDGTGIYIEKNKLLSISRTEVRENPKYTVKDGYLHGVLPGDSVMVALEGESYYFLIPKKTYLHENGSGKSQLYEGTAPGEYLLLVEEENAYYSAMYIAILGDKLALKELNFEQNEFDFRTVRHQKISAAEIPIYLLQPTAEEWQKVMRNFIAYDTYERIKKG